MTYHARVGGTDDVVIPAELAKQLGFEDGDSLIIEHEGDGLVIKTYRQVVRDVQTKFGELLPADYTGNLVDELIAERRAEAARENAESEEWSRDRTPE